MTISLALTALGVSRRVAEPHSQPSLRRSREPDNVQDFATCAQSRILLQRCLSESSNPPRWLRLSQFFRTRKMKDFALPPRFKPPTSLLTLFNRCQADPAAGSDREILPSPVAL